MAGQGRYMPVEGIRQVIRLLSSTEMTINEVAERMSCSRSAVISINRKFQVRTYNGLRSRWTRRDADGEVLLSNVDGFDVPIDSLSLTADNVDLFLRDVSCRGRFRLPPQRE